LAIAVALSIASNDPATLFGMGRDVRKGLLLAA